MFLGFFFFKQKTAYELRISDWSSDVCSSDLIVEQPVDACGRLPDRKAWRARDRRQQSFEPFAAFGQFGRDDRCIAMHFCPDMGSDQADDAFGLSRFEPVAGIDATFPQPVKPPHAVRSDHTTYYLTIRKRAEARREGK